jgi:hypothetical protein
VTYGANKKPGEGGGFRWLCSCGIKLRLQSFMGRDGRVTAHNNNSRKRKAPARTGAEKKDCMYAYDTRQRSRAQ